ncbi:MAG: dienelactone hydrolase family protein [Verrucomicrobiota bacterium]|jgi:dienelactone hydrolase
MRLPTLILAALGTLTLAQAEDARLGPLKDLNGYFPFAAPKSVQAWEPRREFVRRQLLVSQGLWPMPTKTPLNAVIHGKIDQGEYTVEKVYFESAPGFFVTGNLYRPKNASGKAPAVIFPHGHWKDARFLIQPDKYVREEIATGQERFVEGGKSRFQSMCVQLARMGCVVWQIDALSDSDSIQFSPEVIHKFAKQRPEMNRTEGWGLYSAQAEANLQSVMGLQTLNLVRSVDFVLGLPDVDPTRLAVTGSSGGGTQTMLLAAADPRVALSYPVVMVSTAMQGGCTCENATLLRVNSGNVEIAALFAPKPQGMNTANDWTKELATKGFPDLQNLYGLYGKRYFVTLQRGEHFPHNYNAVTRSGFYALLNKHFKLGFEAPIIERDYRPLPKEKLTVWDDAHPAPKAGDQEFERGLLKWLKTDAQQQLQALAQTDEGREKVLRPAIETLIGRPYAQAGAVTFPDASTQWRDSHFRTQGRLLNATYGEEVAVDWLQPINPTGEVVIWLDDAGKGSARLPDGTIRPELQELIDRGVGVLTADLFLQDDKKFKQTRVVTGPREVPAYTYGYNHPLFAQRVHDVMTITSYLLTPRDASQPPIKKVSLAGFGQMGAVAVAARAVTGGAIAKAAVDTGGFRFGQLLDYRHPMFLPGGAKYLDVPGLLCVASAQPLWVAGEQDHTLFRSATLHLDGTDAKAAAAVWLGQ